MDRRISALLANVTVASAALLGGGCFVVDTEHLDDLRNGGADAGMSDAQMPDEDSGTGGEQLNDACGGTSRSTSCSARARPRPCR